MFRLYSRYVYFETNSQPDITRVPYFNFASVRLHRTST
jgi:hypothetical protein